MALVVPRSQVARLGSLPGVQAVYPGRLFKPLTDRSPAFVGAATELWWIVGGPADAGEGVVVGVIDSGVWPEHPSFADPDPSGRRYPPPPATWKGTGCEFGSDVEGDAPFTCNNKLIAAQRIMASHDALYALEPAVPLGAGQHRTRNSYQHHSCRQSRREGSHLRPPARQGLWGRAARPRGDL